MSAFDLALLFATLAVSWLASSMVRRYALEARILDVPNERSSHSSPTPRGGGAAIALSFLGAAGLLYARGDFRGTVALALAAAAAVAVVGFLDDKYSLRAITRFCVHLTAAALAVIAIRGTPGVPAGGFGWAAAVLAVVALTWATNLFNFMDGIDGLAAMEAIFMSGAGALINWRAGGGSGMTLLMLSLAAATLGFLRWNWPPAKLFMGDVGSGLLGFTLGALGLAISRSAGIPWAVWVILSGVFSIDATATLVRRMVRGDRWFEAHRMHAYQHLARRAGSHLPVTLSAAAINVVWLLPWAWAAAFHVQHSTLIAGIALAPLLILALAAGAGRP